METITTERLTLRNFTPEDWRDLYEMIVGYQASEYAQYDHQWPTSEEEIMGVAIWFSEGDSYLAVCLRETGKLIGLVSLNPKEDEQVLTSGLGYIFNFDYHGRGYATEACQAAMEHVFMRLGAERIVTGTAPQNTPSRRLLARLGLRQIGEGEYTLTRQEWLVRRGAEAEAGQEGGQDERQA
jgi:RimJ/RimL family protein N-acetyltransferase